MPSWRLLARGVVGARMLLELGVWAWRLGSALASRWRLFRLFFEEPESSGPYFHDQLAQVDGTSIHWSMQLAVFVLKTH